MSNSEHFHSNIDSREYRINYSFNCDSSNVVYLLECTVCGVQYVGSTCTPFRLRFNNYKACSRKFNLGASYFGGLSGASLSLIVYIYIYTYQMKLLIKCNQMVHV